MKSTSFKQYGTSCLLLPDAAAPGTDSRAAFVSTASAVPATLTLADALTSDGAFVFFGNLPTVTADIDTLAAALKSYISGTGVVTNKFFWFDSIEATNLNATPMAVSGSVAPITTSSLISFTLRNITLNVTGGATVAVDGSGVGLEFSPASGAPHSIDAGSATGGNTQTINFSASLILNILGGPDEAGTFAGAQALKEDDIEALNAGLLYVIPAAPGNGGYTDYASYRLFDFKAPGAPTALDLAVGIDPLQHGPKGRSHWAFTKPDTLASHYVNALGVQMGMAPSITGATPPRFVMAEWQIRSSDITGGGSGSPNFYYLTPEGDFELSLWTGGGTTPPTGTYSSSLMPGSSGAEYFDIGTSGTFMSFSSGHNAYADVDVGDNASGGKTPPPVCKGLSSYATTSWATLNNTAGVQYFSQPERAMQHGVPTAAPAAGKAAFMNYLPLLAGELPATPSTAFPVTPIKGYGGSVDMTLPIAQAIEKQLLSPNRRQAIPATASIGETVAASSTTAGATPQGFILNLKGSAWETLTFAKTADTRFPTLALSNVRSTLKQAFLTDSLFLAVSSAKAFQQNADYDYELTAEAVQALVTEKKITVAIQTALAPLISSTATPRVYPSVAAFDAAVKTAINDPATYTACKPYLNSSAAKFTLVIADWKFDLAAENWSKHGTILLFKFVDQPLSALVKNTNGWFDQGKTFNDSPRGTQEALASYVESARKQAKTNGDMAAFVQQVIDNPYWQGMLAVNTEVPLSELPAQLEGLAAGIDPAQFYAHHVGVRMTPLEPDATGVSQKRSNTFGLINYQEPTLLSAGTPYNFKVLSLKATFANAALTGFSSRVDLFIDQLFGDGVTAVGGNAGNNLLFNGVYQKVDGVGSYIFTTTEKAIYRSSGAVLGDVAIDQAQFVTLTPTAAQAAQNDVNTLFLMKGKMQFNSLPTDLFGYGADDGSMDAGLAFSDLSIHMDFNSATPAYKKFTFDTSHIAFSAPATQRRSDSLVDHFPIKLKGLVSGTGQPGSLGFMPVDIGFSSSGTNGDWYALEYELNMGSLGALAAKAGFIARFILAWSPGPKGEGGNYPIYVGLGLPGVKNGNRAISLESVIKLTFGEIRLLSSGDSYILEIRNIALKLLAFTFPQVGQTSFYIFGDPKNSGSDAVGWYGGYAKSGSVINGSGSRTNVGGQGAGS